MKRRAPIDRQHDSLLGRNALILLVLLFVLGAITLLSHLFMDDIYTLKTKLDLQGTADDINTLNLSDEHTNAVLSDLEAANNFYIEIYYPRDKLIYTTDANNSIFETTQEEDASQQLKPRMMRIMQQEQVDLNSYFELQQEYFTTAKYLVYGTILDSGASTVIYASIDIITSNARITDRIVFSVVVLLAILIFVLFSVQSFGVTIPLSKINRITKRLAQMDFDMVCPPFRMRELDELSGNVNRLSASLDMTMKTLKRRNAQLEQDIEKEKELLENRKQFIANASHELKTPIAIIQGYTEGLKYGIYDDNREACYDVILEEAQKMNKLVIRLMEVNRLNATAIAPVYVNDPLQKHISAFIQSLENIFVKNGISVTCDINPNYVAYTDKDLFERVLSNYVSNAISHCTGEKRIEITCDSVDDCYRIRVYNTGTPIAEEDLPNIWNSFYRADKAHSRSEGRFGLGLSIVASAQQSQGMLYGVENHARGVEFWFDVRKASPDDADGKAANA